MPSATSGRAIPDPRFEMVRRYERADDRCLWRGFLRRPFKFKLHVVPLSAVPRYMQFSSEHYGARGHPEHGEHERAKPNGFLLIHAVSSMSSFQAVSGSTSTRLAPLPTRARTVESSLRTPSSERFRRSRRGDSSTRRAVVGTLVRRPSPACTRFSSGWKALCSMPLASASTLR